MFLCEIMCVEVGCVVFVFILYLVVGGNLVLFLRNCFGKGEGGIFVDEVKVFVVVVFIFLLNGSVGIVWIFDVLF